MYIYRNLKKELGKKGKSSPLIGKAFSLIKIITKMQLGTISCLGIMLSSLKATKKVALLQTGGLQNNAGHHWAAGPSVHYENLTSCKYQLSHL